MGTIEPGKPADSRQCDPRRETACVVEKYLFCTTGFCVKEINIAPGAVWRNSDHSSDQMLIAVSDYKFSYDRKGKAPRVLSRKSGEVENFPRDLADRIANVVNVPARIIDVVFR